MTTTSPMTLTEAVESFTGYDEEYIAQRFGGNIGDLLEANPISGYRAAAMVMFVRDLTAQDVKDPKGKAYKQAMELTIRQASEFWPDEEPDLDPDHPETEAGKDASLADE